MTRRRRAGGLTLIEIMLSLLVMVLGLLGILAVFPVGLQSSSESVEETYAAILSESVAHAFKNAVQFGKYDVTTSEWTCVMAHDLLAGGTAVRFTFALPKLSDGWKQFPGGGSIDKGKAVNADPEQDSHFELCGDQWTYATVQNVWNVNDPTDPWKQFAFSFVVKKINTLEYLMRPVPQINPATGAAYTLKDLEPLTKLYELRVRVFRVANQAAGAGAAASSRKKLISEVSYRVCTR